MKNDNGERLKKAAEESKHGNPWPMIETLKDIGLNIQELVIVPVENKDNENDTSLPARK